MRTFRLASALVLLGGGSAVAAISPVARTLTAGYAHTCAIVGGDETLRCVGANDYGQLGNGTAQALHANPVPNDVEAGTFFSEVAGGLNHTCVIGRAGTAVRCWGWNAYGQLGTGDFDDRATPALALGPTDAYAALATGDIHTCVATESGAVGCWGDNEYGQLGNGQAGCDPDAPERCRSPSPVAVPGLRGVKQLTAGVGFTCALTGTGAVSCWGGRFGTRPSPIPGLGSGVTGISAGNGHMCAVTAAGAVKCLGDDEFGELGDGRSGIGKQALTPVTVIAKGAAAIGAGWDHTCVVTTKGAIACWGRNAHGEVGDGTTRLRSRPVPVLGPDSDASEVVGGYGYTCARLHEVQIYCWGFNQFGRLGDGTNADERLRPVRSLLGSGTVGFLAHGTARRVLKGPGHRFELTKIVGRGELDFDTAGHGPRKIVGGTGRIVVRQSKIYSHGVVDEEQLTLDVVVPGGQYSADSSARVLDLNVSVVKAEGAEGCEKGDTGRVTLIDSEGTHDGAGVHVCDMESLLAAVHRRLLVAIEAG